MQVTMVKGPATVVVKGECHVLGSDVSDRTVEVKAGKALPFEPCNHCELDVTLGQGGETWQADSSVAGMSMWQDVACMALARHSTVMLAGDTDTGKTTLSTFLANVALGLGMKPCVVDGDVGQGDIAPPAAMGAATISKTVTDLRDAYANLFEFVGSISPVGLERVAAAKLARITDRSGSLGDVRIVNTDGYARNGGVSYKVMIANRLQPDAIICVGDNQELAGALESARHRVLRAPSSSQAVKSRSERIGRRLDQFLLHVGSGTAGAELSQVKFVYMGRIFSPRHLYNPPLAQLDPRNIRGMFVGLGSRNNVSGFGIVTSLSFGKIRIQTGVRGFTRIYLSNVRLSRDRTREIKIS
jgi:polynucleotide 5'-hydroxyl-kinase GRC3/NOL9